MSKLDRIDESTSDIIPGSGVQSERKTNTQYLRGTIGRLNKLLDHFGIQHGNPDEGA